MRGNTLLCAALAALALCGCTDAGTSTGNPAPKDDAGDPPRGEDNDGSGGAPTLGGYCNAGEKTPLALDADSPLGFSPNDILAFAAGSHDETIRWNEQMNLEYGPESGEGTVAITITPKGTAHHVEPAPPSNFIDSGGALGIDNTCTSWVEIDVEVTVESSGGAIDESFDAVLRAHTPLMTALYVSIKPEDFQGSFEAQGTGGLAGFVLGGLDIGLRFSSFGVSGTFHGWLTSPPSAGDQHQQAAVGGGEPFATIGAAACNDGGFAVGATDEVEGVTVQEALDMLGEHSEIDITWEDETTTTSTFAFAPTTGGGCVLLDNEVPGDLTIVIDGTLSMASADERLDGTFEGRFEAHVEDGAISRIAFHVADNRMSNVALGGAYYGFPAIDISTYDAAGTAIDITVTPMTIEGTITLIAYTHQCDERPAPPDEPSGDDPGEGSGSGEGGDPENSEGSSSPGCAGAVPTELATGVLR